MAWIFFRSRIHDAHHPVSILADPSQLPCPRVYPVQDPPEARHARAEFRRRSLPSRHREPRSAPAQQLLPRKCGLGRFDSPEDFSFGSQFPLDEFLVLHHARGTWRLERFFFGKLLPQLHVSSRHRHPSNAAESVAGIGSPDSIIQTDSSRTPASSSRTRYSTCSDTPALTSI